MKKLLIIALSALFSLPSFANICQINGKTFKCDGNLYVKNGRGWCNGQEIMPEENSGNVAKNGHNCIIEGSWIWGTVTQTATSNGIQGSGKTETKQVPIKNIRKISTSSSGNLFIKQCENPQNCIEMLTVTADDNILPYLKQDIYGNELTLRSENNVSFYPQTPIHYHATVKDINNISNSGSMDIQSSYISTDNLTLKTSASGDITIKDLIAKQLIINQAGSSDIKAHINTDKLTVNSESSGDIIIAGNTNMQAINTSGSGDYKAKQLKSNISSVKSSGSGDISLTAIEKITGYSSGSGSILYNPQYNPYVDVKKTGSGKLKKSSW